MQLELDLVFRASLGLGKRQDSVALGVVGTPPKVLCALSILRLALAQLRW